MRTSSNFPFSKVRTSSGSSKRLRMVSIVVIARTIKTTKALQLPWTLRQLIFFLHNFRVGRERDQRKVFAVQVVHQVENARETGAGEERLIPRPVVLLRAEKVGDAAR